MSRESMCISSIYTSSEQFKVCYERLIGLEQNSLISHVIVNNTPFVFKDIPLLYEQIIQYLSDLLSIESGSIKLMEVQKLDSQLVLHQIMAKFSQKKVI